MDVHKLFLGCRMGDLESVKYLVETKEIELNIRDHWDSTPLYYACFCGHEELVDYLLQCGAKCEPNTFDGERCLYGALSDKIRNVLKNYKAITSHCMRRDNYQEFLRRLLQQGSYEDISFMVLNDKFTAHRCILSARSEYFAEMIKTRWSTKASINLRHPLVRPYAFEAILHYIYTDRLQVHMDDIDDVIRLAKQCQLFGLIERMDDAIKKTDSFVCAKPGTRVTVISIETDENNCQLHEQLGVLAEQAIPNQINWVSHGELPFFTEEDNKPYFADICFSVKGYPFYCHKVFFCCRSDYFKAVLNDHFSEMDTESQQGIPVVYLQDVDADVFSHVVRYLYTDRPQVLPGLAYDVLCVADRYLLPGLKRLCANVMSQHLDQFNVISVVRAARLYELHRLEDQCTEYMSFILDKIIYTDEFAELIQEDASSVQEREETDSIPIIDDIRYHISCNVSTYSDMSEANEKLAALDELLISLDVEC